jgi:carboxymethylenebutenolidase
MTAKTVELTAGDGSKFSAYLALPSAGKAPVIIVLQEIFGVNGAIRAAADALAAAGFIAIAPDLFWRQEPGVQLDPGSEADRERAGSLMKGLDQPLAVQDALVALGYALALGQANGKAGAVGYCLGGKLAYLMAMQPQVDAAVSYYGVGIQSALDQAGDVRARLLLHIAGDDHLCPPDAQKNIAEAMAGNDRISIIVHPGVGHAFARLGSPARDPAAAQRADAATLALLRDELTAA